MTEASQSILTTKGLEKAQNAKISGVKISLTRVCISDYLINSSDVPDIPSWDRLKGTVVFDTDNYITTDNNLLRAHKRVSSETERSCVIITLHLGYSYGDFICGSLGCYLDDGTLFAVIKLSQIFSKLKKNSLNPGNSLEIPLAITITDGDVLNISVLETSTATIPEVTSYEDLPEADTAEYSMYIVYNYTGDGTPAVASRVETSEGSYWSFTLLAKDGWSNDFIQEELSKIPYDNKTVVKYDGELETWSKASGEDLNDTVNPYIGTNLSDLSLETINYNTQVYNKPKLKNSLDQEITLQSTVDTNLLNLVDKQDIEIENTELNKDDKVFSTSAIQSIKEELNQSINSNSIKSLSTNRPLVFNSETNQLDLLLDTELSSYSNNPVQNQAIYRELDTKYTKKDELAAVAFSGDYEDLTNKPEDTGNITQYVEELPEIPNNFLYEKVTELFTFIGAYNLTDESFSLGYSMTEEGLMLEETTLVCSWEDLPANWAEGEKYSQLFEVSGTKVGNVVIYEKDGIRYFVPDEVNDPDLYLRQLYYVTSKTKNSYYNEIMLKNTVIDMIENAKYQFISLSLGASGTTYTMTKSGILFLNKKNSAGNLTTTCNVQISSSSGLKSNAFGNSAVSNLVAQVSVRKGDKITITYNTTGATNSFGLYYLNYKS